jgi:hypothetical protein
MIAPRYPYAANMPGSRLSTSFRSFVNRLEQMLSAGQFFISEPSIHRLDRSEIYYNSETVHRTYLSQCGRGVDIATTDLGEGQLAYSIGAPNPRRTASRDNSLITSRDDGHEVFLRCKIIASAVQRH